ncbi:MAG: tRNA lysidine(34) synthetase TilS [Algisphaera sp.]
MPPPAPPATTDSPHYHPLVRALAQGLRDRCQVQEGDHVLVACSGGADSTALLRALHLLAPRRRWELRLTVAHVQHHLRGEAAEQDADFVKTLAQQCGAAYQRADITPGHAAGNMEANARDQRYAALTTLAAAVGAHCVATAHHADDQLETLLMAMVRGTGPTGLRGIAWTRPLNDNVRLIRPMLSATHDQALNLLATLKQDWRDDATNRDTDRTRARLRRDVIPVLRDLNPAAAQNALALSDRIRKALSTDKSDADESPTV